MLVHVGCIEDCWRLAVRAVFSILCQLFIMPDKVGSASFFKTEHNLNQCKLSLDSI
jgi:hypothetical protein